MTLNYEQKKFAERVFAGDFLNLILSGEAGTGKTYTLAEIISELALQDKDICISAPTHAALNTIRAKFEDKVINTGNITFATVASILSRFGFRTKFGDTAFASPNAKRLQGYDLVVVDEFSMIGEKEQIQLLNCDIPTIFTGDLAQLPVVMQKKPEWVNNPKLETFNLTKQERQLGIIHKLALKCRESIYLPSAIDTKAGTVEIALTKDELLSKMLTKMKHADKVEYANFRYLSYRNEEVEYANNFFHQQLFGNDPFYVGEYIMTRQTNSSVYNGQISAIKEIVSIKESELYGVKEYYLLLDTDVIVRVLSPADSKKIHNKCEYLKVLIRRAHESKNYDGMQSLLKELELLENTWVNWTYCFSTTVHKSQGSTIPHVFVDIQSFKRASNKRALLYVAISRASETICFTTYERYVPKRKNKKPTIKLWKCTVTGYITNAGGLTAYQKKRNIPTSNREFVGTK